MKNKLVLATATLGMLIGLAGCGPHSEPSSEVPSSEAPSLDPSTEPSTTTEPVEEPWEIKGFSYATAEPEVKAEIVAKLEKYAMDKHISGVSIFEDGGFMMIHERVKKAAPKYITGYGFGILSEGELTAPLKSEEKEEWKMYLHNLLVNDPHNVNHLADKGEVVSDLASYISSAYWGTRMNDTHDGYVWYPVLARDDCPRPIPVEPNEYGWSKTWKIRVKTGVDGLKYDTNSAKHAWMYKGKGVELEDYRTGLMLLLTQSFGFFRGAEMANDASYGIAGAAKYQNVTKTALKKDDAIDSWPKLVDLFNNTVKCKLDESDRSLTITLNRAMSPFYAMYGLSSSFYQPIPISFLSAIGGGDIFAGVKNYSNFNNDMNSTPVDNTLSVGPYTLESWERDKNIVFKRNDNWVERSNPELAHRNKIAGVKYTIMAGMKDDHTLGFKEFLAKHTDSSGIPLQYLDKYRDDPRTVIVEGSSVTKMNINSCTQERWEELFGEEGSISPTPKSDYWQCRPWMSNENFLRGFNCAINRQEFADKRGFVPSNEYFSSAYMIDPENGISYNSTEAHQEAMKDYFPATHGYNLEAAKKYFKKAVEELVEDEAIALGTPSKPTEITVRYAWMRAALVQSVGLDFAQYIEDAFNDPSVSGNCVKLVSDHTQIYADYLDFYDDVMRGHFDFGLGGIEGNTYDPLDFMEVLRSDNSSGFTLNWGVADTAVPDPELIYDGAVWSYNSLWQAGMTGVVVDREGNEVEYISAEYGEDVSFATLKESGATLNFSYKVDPRCKNIEVEPVSIGISTVNAYLELTVENGFVYDPETGTASFSISKELAIDLNDSIKNYLLSKGKEVGSDDWFLTEDFYGMFWVVDLNYTLSIDGSMPIENWVTIYFPSPEAPEA